MMLDKQQFLDYAAAGYNRSPLAREVLADLETPVSAYLKLADAPYSYLLESVQGGEKWGRYSIIGLPSDTRLEVRGRTIRFITKGQLENDIQVDDPLEQIRFRFRRGFIGGCRTVLPVAPGIGNHDVAADAVEHILYGRPVWQLTEMIAVACIVEHLLGLSSRRTESDRQCCGLVHHLDAPSRRRASQGPGRRLAWRFA